MYPRPTTDHPAAAEFQPIVLCGPGSALLPITATTPKALLPVAGKPQLHYALQWLDASPLVRDTLVIACASSADQITAYLRTLDPTRRPELVSVDDKLGPAAALRKAHALGKMRAKLHPIVMAVDAVPSDPLASLLDAFKLHSAAALALLFPAAADNSDHLVGLAPLPVLPTGSSPALSLVHRLVLSSPLAGVGKHANFPVRLDMVREFPSVRLAKLVDAHLYIMRNWVADVLVGERPDLDTALEGLAAKVAAATSLQHDLMPWIIRAQFSPAAHALFEEQTADDLAKEDAADSRSGTVDDLLTPDAAAAADDELAVVGLPRLSDRRRHPLVLGYVPRPLDALLSDTSSSAAGGDSSSAADPFGSTTSLASTQAGSGGVTMPAYAQLSALGCYGLRANTPAAYAEANRVLARVVTDRLAASAVVPPRSQVGPESMVGDATTLGERCSVKKSVVGAHCTLGKGVKLVNCVVMDNVVLEDDVKLEGCVICAGAKVQEKCVLKDAVVGAKAVVPRDTNSRNERYA